MPILKQTAGGPRWTYSVEGDVVGIDDVGGGSTLGGYCFVVMRTGEHVISEGFRYAW